MHTRCKIREMAALEDREPEIWKGGRGVKRKGKHHRQQGQSIEVSPWHLGDKMKTRGQEKRMQGWCRVRSERQTGPTSEAFVQQSKKSVLFLKNNEKPMRILSQWHISKGSSGCSVIYGVLYWGQNSKQGLLGDWHSRIGRGDGALTMEAVTEWKRGGYIQGMLGRRSRGACWWIACGGLQLPAKPRLFWHSHFSGPDSTVCTII